MHCFFLPILVVLLKSQFADEWFFAYLDFFAISIYNMFISVMVCSKGMGIARIEVTSAVCRVCDKPVILPEDLSGSKNINKKGEHHK